MKVTDIEELNTFVNTVSSESRAEAAKWSLGVSRCLNNRHACLAHVMFVKNSDYFTSIEQKIHINTRCMDSLKILEDPAKLGQSA